MTLDIQCEADPFDAERLLKAAGQTAPSVKPTLKINQTHALVTRLDAESDEDRFADWANLPNK